MGVSKDTRGADSLRTILARKVREIDIVFDWVIRRLVD